MTSEALDLRAIQLSRQLGADGQPIPHGYRLPNGVVVVWIGGSNSANVGGRGEVTGLELARQRFPNLVLVD
jgi:hypothetical protein